MPQAGPADWEAAPVYPMSRSPLMADYMLRRRQRRQDDRQCIRYEDTAVLGAISSTPRSSFPMSMLPTTSQIMCCPSHRANLSPLGCLPEWTEYSAPVLSGYRKTMCHLRFV